jgi:hypothetical protein
MAANTVTTMVHVTGPQDGMLDVHHPGTADAVLSVGVGRALFYVRTVAAAERIAAIWQGATVDALRLPNQLPPARSRSRGGWAEPSVVVHTGGVPPGGSTLVARSGSPAVLLISVGEVRFHVYDRRAFTDCAKVFVAAATRARQQLPEQDVRLRPVLPDAHAALLGGALAARAVDELPVLAQLQEHAGAINNGLAGLTELMKGLGEAGLTGTGPVARAVAALTPQRRPPTPAKSATSTSATTPPAAGSPTQPRTQAGSGRDDPPTGRSR